MVWTDLPTNYKDVSWSGLRKYQMVKNPDGTVSFVDVTIYTDTESSFLSAEDLNKANEAINDMMAGQVFATKESLVSIVADEFSIENNYSKGDYVLYGNELYKFTEDHSAGAWDVNDVELINITDEITYNRGYWGEIEGTLSDQTDLKNALDDKADKTDTYTKTETDNLLDEKANTSDLGELADHDTVDYESEVTNKPELGTLSSEDDVSSDDKHYLRKNGEWYDADNRYYTESETDTLLSGKSNTDHNHDSRYYTESEVNELLSAKADTSDLGDLAAKDKVDWDTDIDDIPNSFPPSSHNHDDRYYTGTEVNNLLSGKSDTDHTHDDRYYTESEIDEKLAAKQPTLTFDSTPTADSANPVTSGGIKTALDLKANSADVYSKSESDALLVNKATVITESASGSIVSIEDGAPMPVTALTVGIEPVQDLHGQANPYPAGDGANCLSPVASGTFTQNGVTVTSDGNGKFSVSGTASADADIIMTLTTPITIPVGGYFHMLNSKSFSTSSGQIGFYDNSNNRIGSMINLDPANRILSVNSSREDQTVYKISLYFTSGTVTNFSISPMILMTDTATSFSPYSNICPISGWSQAVVTRTGKNLLKPPSSSGSVSQVDFTVNSDGTIKANGTASSNASFYFVGGNNTYASPNIPVGTYIMSGITTSNGEANLYVVRDDTTIVANVSDSSEQTFAIESGRKYRILLRINNGKTVNNQVFYPMIRPASNADGTYEPYSGTSVTIDLDGTRYGGNINVLTGEMVVTHGMLNLGDLTWNYNSSKKCFYNESYKNEVGGGNDIYCSIYRKLPVALNNTSIANNDKFIRLNKPQESGNFASGAIVIKDTTYSDTDLFKTSLSGQTLVYPLATPLTVQLTENQLSTLLGENHIFADSGDVSVTYRADTKRYVDGQIAKSQRATRSLIAGVETSMVATKNYSQGDYLIVGDDMYKVTSNIANGGNITVGTNVTKVTVAEALVSLAS